MRRSGPVLVLGFEGVTDRNAAEALRGTSLTLDSASLPIPDDPDEFYDHQLVGLTAVDAVGRPSAPWSRSCTRRRRRCWW